MNIFGKHAGAKAASAAGSKTGAEAASAAGSRTGAEAASGAGAVFGRGRLGRKVLLLVAAVLLLEVFVFNAPFWESLLISAHGTSDQAEITCGSGIQREGNTYTVTSTDDATIYLSGFTSDPDNIHFELSAPGETSAQAGHSLFPSAGTTYSLTLAAVGEDGSAFTFPETTISTGLAETQYVRLHSLTAAQTLRVTVNAAEGTQFVLAGATTNVVRPLMPSALRMLVLLILGAVTLALRPKSVLYRRQLDFGARWQRVAMACIVAAGIVGACVIGTLTDQERLVEQGAYFDTYLVHEKDENQYNHLADAFLAGRVSLDLPVSDILLELDNPYNTGARTALNAEAQDPIYWDYAYYDGNYYCYFGALPVLLTFLPFKALTGADLPTWASAMFFAALLCGCMFFLLKKLRDVYFPRVSFGSFTLGLLLCYSSWGIIEQMFLPRIYAVPILSALVFATAGVAFWLCAKERMAKGQHAGAGVPGVAGAGAGAAGAESAGASAATSPAAHARTHAYTRISRAGHTKYLVAGAFCIALTLGCRPSFILTCVLAFAIFWPEITRGRQFFSRRGLGNTAAVIVPFLVVAVPVMLYNHARFGSFFDFGANYNLTGGDMTSRGLSIGRLAVGYFEYLLQPLNLHPVFPFVNSVADYISSNGYMGPVSCEPFYGGLLALCPALLLGAYVFARRRSAALAGTGAVGLCGASLALAFVVLNLDIQVSGMVMRYFADFAWLVSIPAVLATWMLTSSAHMFACAPDCAPADSPAQSGGEGAATQPAPSAELAAGEARGAGVAGGAFATKTPGQARVSSYVIVGLIFAGFLLYTITLFGTERFDALVSTCPTLFYTIKSWFIPFV